MNKRLPRYGAPSPSRYERLKSLNLNLLLVFDALLQYGSVTRSARELGVTQGAVSQSLSRLREFFGDPLFVKSRNGVVASPKAQALAGTIRRIVMAARDDLFAEADFDPAKAARVIKLGLSDGAELAIAPILIEKIRKTAPGCVVKTVETVDSSLDHLLEAGGVDVVVAGPMPLSGDIVQQRIYHQSFTVVASTACRHERRITLSQYASMEHVVVPPGRLSTLAIEKALEDLGVTRYARLSTPHFLAVPAILQNNPEVIATVPRFVADAFVQQAAVKILEPTFKLPAVTAYQYWHRRHAADRFSLWLRALLREAALQNKKLQRLPPTSA